MKSTHKLFRGKRRGKHLVFVYTLSGRTLKGVLHPWALFLKTLCIFSKNKATSEKVSHGSGQKMFQRTQKSQFYFSRDHCCEVTVENV